MQTYAERLTPPVALWVGVWVGAAVLGMILFSGDISARVFTVHLG